ncbi:MAG: hypothetical protein V4573_00355 [Pseudomonadota bacterium]
MLIKSADDKSKGLTLLQNLQQSLWMRARQNSFANKCVQTLIQCLLWMQLGEVWYGRFC